MTSPCDQAVEQLYEYIDQEITWTRKVRIRWHLRRCHDCNDAFAFEQKLKSIIRAKSVDEPPPELFDRIRALLQEQVDDLEA